MKLVVLILGLLLAVNSLPLDNEGPNYAMVPDGEGNFHLVDLNVDPEPESRFVPANDVVFMLFTSNNPTSAQVLRLNDAASITSSNFNANNPTRFTIHGWNSNGNSGVNTSIRNAFLGRGNFNVIVVDWGAGAQTPNYIAARNRVGPVGVHLANFIRFLNTVTGANPAEMSIIGHSLGAHVSGHAGKNIGSGFRIGVISAMDAADPGFSEGDTAGRVHHDDANYVESIHTNGGTLGIFWPIGDASFYPNFGRSQPGCGIDIAGNCAHSRAHQFFAESVATNNFWGRRCRDINDITNSNCVASGTSHRMGGEPADTAARGIFWVPVNGSPPFSQGPL